jgi:hypothetical protein
VTILVVVETTGNGSRRLHRGLDRGCNLDCGRLKFLWRQHNQPGFLIDGRIQRGLDAGFPRPQLPRQETTHRDDARDDQGMKYSV